MTLPLWAYVLFYGSLTGAVVYGAVVVFKKITDYGASKEREDRAAEKNATNEASLASAKDQIKILGQPDDDVAGLLSDMRNNEL